MAGSLGGQGRRFRYTLIKWDYITDANIILKASIVVLYEFLKK